MDSFQLVPYDVSLNSKQKNLINMPYYESSISTAYAYAQEKKGILREIVSPLNLISNSTSELHQISMAADVSVAISSAVATSTITGSVVANVLGEQACLATISQISMSPLGASMLFSSISGLLIFEGLVICKNIHKIITSSHYAAWKLQRIRMMKEKRTIEMFNEDEILKHLLCPISGSIPRIPAKDRCDNTFDYETAINWIASNPNMPLPGSSQISRRDHLKFDYAHINSVIERLSNLKFILQNKCNTIAMNILGVRNQNSNDENTIAAWNLIQMIRISQENGYLNYSQAFGGHHSLNFIENVIGYGVNTSYRQRIARKNKYIHDSRVFREILTNINHSNSQEDLNMAERRLRRYEQDHASFIVQTSQIKKIRIDISSNKFLNFFRSLTGQTEIYDSRITRELDDSVLSHGTHGWASRF